MSEGRSEGTYRIGGQAGARQGPCGPASCVRGGAGPGGCGFAIAGRAYRASLPDTIDRGEGTDGVGDICRADVQGCSGRAGKVGPACAPDAPGACAAMQWRQSAWQGRSGQGQWASLVRTVGAVRERHGGGRDDLQILEHLWEGGGDGGAGTPSGEGHTAARSRGHAPRTAPPCAGERAEATCRRESRGRLPASGRACSVRGSKRSAEAWMLCSASSSPMHSGVGNDGRQAFPARVRAQFVWVRLVKYGRTLGMRARPRAAHQTRRR
jgi:hypothetical protein